jgi:eukaryotic-like serine/threonine-protein kinase
VAAAQASHLTETGMVMGTAMYVSPEQATGAQVTEASDIYSLGVVAYECLAGHPPFTAREPLAIAFAHKHEPVPALPQDVPQPVSDLVYHMLAKTPAERPASIRVVADRADMLRDALAMSEPAEPGYPGATRADLPAAGTSALPGAGDPGTAPPRGPGGWRYSGRRRQLVAAGSTAVLCAAAAAAGLYLTGHISGRGSGDVNTNTAQHLSSPATQTHQASQSLPSSPTPTPSLTVKPTAEVPSPSGNPKPTKSVKPTTSPRSSPPTSPSSSASGSSTSTVSSTPTSPGPTSSSPT